MYKEQFHQKVKKARKNTGFTQKEVAKEVDISESQLSKIENGTLEPNIETLGKLADFYEVSADWLLGTKGKNK